MALSMADTIEEIIDLLQPVWESDALMPEANILAAIHLARIALAHDGGYPCGQGTHCDQAVCANDPLLVVS